MWIVCVCARARGGVRAALWDCDVWETLLRAPWGLRLSGRKEEDDVDWGWEEGLIVEVALEVRKPASAHGDRFSAQRHGSSFSGTLVCGSP